MKRILIGNGYVIDIEPHNWTLKKNIKKKLNKDGIEKESSTDIGYFGSLEGCLKALYKDKCVIRLKNENTIQEAVKVFKQCYKEVSEVSKKFDFTLED